MWRSRGGMAGRIWSLARERLLDMYSKQLLLVWRVCVLGKQGNAISLWSSKHLDISKIFIFFSSTGRTFPTHPYFSAQLGAGQLSLFNLLKAYSLLDKEVGYCQGISFVAGVLLLHMSEEQAFEMLKFLMYDLGFRKQYRPDMMSLQVRQ